MGRRAKPQKGQPARKSAQTGGWQVRDLQKQLAEARQREAAVAEREAVALEQQAATSKILELISSSPTDVQPALDAMAESATRLCASYDANIFRLDGDVLRLVAHHGPLVVPLGHVASVTRGTVTGRAVLDRQPVQAADLQTEVDEFPDSSPTAQKFGYRTTLGVPLLREGKAIGAISLRRTEVQPFTDKQIELLKTFADQAVIAVENARLFTELQEKTQAVTQAHAQVTETLERQTATTDVLRIISGAPNDLQPVFNAILDSVMRLFRPWSANVWRFDGELIHLTGTRGGPSGAGRSIGERFPTRPTEGLTVGRCILERAVIEIHDVETDAGVIAATREMARTRGWRSALAVPMLRDGEPVGAIMVTRIVPGRFEPGGVELLQTFADQAVIAIANVRLFTELQASNRELTTALDTQTATSDILRVISGSRTDIQPVFDAILGSALRLLGGYSGGLTRLVGDQIVLVALTSTDPAGDSARWALYPQPLHSESNTSSTHAQAIRSRAPVNVADAQEDPLSPEAFRAAARARGVRSVVAVPLLRHDEPVGAMTVTRREAGGFTDDEIALLQTFADQAVIAIENARLLTELQTRTAELTRSVGQLTALGEVGQAVSSSLDLETVLTTIVSRAVQLSGLDGGVVFEYDEATQRFIPRAAIGTANRVTGAREGIRRGEGVVGRMALTLQPVQIPDIAVVGAYEARIREDLIAAGVRALVAVPILREGRLIGGLVVNRKQPDEVSPDTVELLQTFAAQSALAIQNARLFRELEIKSRELEVASQHKSEFLASMSHELRTPLNAIIGFSDVLLQGMFGEMADKQTEYVQDILASGQHLLSLINDILDLSKIEAGRMELDLADFHLPAAIDDALLLMRERAARRGLTLERHVDERLSDIQGDQRKVKQVLLNLLSNAVKFTPEGGRIDVSAALVDDTAEVSVTDTGVGIAPEDHDAVFEEFRQVGQSDKKAEGTGLGLALCRKFVELHGGRIRLKSQLGQGSTFTFTLPRRRDQTGG